MVGPSSQISKILLTLLFLLIIWFILMDTQLYVRIQNYEIDRSFHYNVTPQALQQLQNIHNKHQNSFSTMNSIEYKVGDKLGELGSSAASSTHLITFDTLVNNSPTLDKTDKPKYRSTKKSDNISNHDKQHGEKYEHHTWISCAINPLCHVTVKAIMLDHVNHYLFAPIAKIFDDIIGFSRSKFITANMISTFHVFVAIAAARLVASDCLSYRRIGVVLFQFRTFLDDLDGHVARAKKNIRGERSEIGTSGYYIDGLCDGLGCIALLIGMFVFLKNNPPRRRYTQLQAILPITDTKNSDSGVVYKVKVTTKKVLRKVLCFAGQLLLSSTAWNRYIALYQDMLERNDVSITQFRRQNFILRSNWFFSIAWLWRVFNVHAMLHCVLLSIFCDKLWDFLRIVQYGGYVILLISICVTEMHVLEVQNFIYKSLTGNYTSV